MARVLLFTHPSSECGGGQIADIEVSRVPAVGEWLTIDRDAERRSYAVRRVQHLSYTVPAQGEPLLRGTSNDRWAIDAELWVQEVRQADFFNQ